MQKLKMQSVDITAQNIEKIAALFPNCVTEREHNGKLEQAIDFDLLKQELSRSIVEGKQERYQLNWVGKADATVLANTPINKTLRPCREESVNFDSTENLFIEGDNLDALKLLQETYLGKVKMIYIDPPYNTGKDFIYKDNFAMESGEYRLESGQVDDEGNRLVINSESNGRFHSDWLSMMYSRLKLARNLLTDDGVIFISIDDNEQANLKRICDEVFGEGNFVGQISRATGTTTGQGAQDIGSSLDYLFIYRKSDSFHLNGLQLSEDDEKRFSEEDENGKFSYLQLRKTGNADRREDRPLMYYAVISPTGEEVYPIGPTGYESRWRVGLETYQKLVTDNMILWKESRNGVLQPYVKYYLEGRTKQVSNLWSDLDGNKKGSIELKDLLGSKNIFDNPKPIQLIKRCIEISTTKEDVILDFFAGSGSTAHAIMAFNAEDGGNRKFIMVQIPEQTDEKSEAHKAGYKTIAEISKERIRRAGQKIVQELADNQKATEHLDIGFRVLKIDSSNMADIYYTPQQLQQGDMFNQVEHIKADRSEEDLLFQVLLDWGVDLTLPIEKRVINGKNVFFVDQSVLVACFDKEIDEELIKAITQYQPLRAVFRDDGFINDPTKINAEQLFKQLAPHSELRVI